MSLSSMTTGSTITVKRATIAQNAQGFTTETYAAVAALTDVSARVTHLSNNELIRYGKIGDHERAMVVYMEGDVDIRATDEVTWNGRDWHVTEVERNRVSPSGSLAYTKFVMRDAVNSG